MAARRRRRAHHVPDHCRDWLAGHKVACPLTILAQVWAHPDDLATIIQGIRAQEQLGGPRVVSAGAVDWACCGGLEQQPMAGHRACA